MQIAVLVFGQFRSAREHLVRNLQEIKKAFSGLDTPPTFHAYILTDKLESGNYSEKNQEFVMEAFEEHNFSIKFLEFWEEFPECYVIESLLNGHMHKISEGKLFYRAEWAASLWYRRYILWKFFESFATNNNLTYDKVLFTRIFDTSIVTLKPLTPLLHSFPDTLYYCIDTLFLGSHTMMKLLFHFGSSTEFWRSFEWTPEFTQEFAKFDLCLSETKLIFSSEAQVYNYIRTHILNHKNIRYDFSNPDTNQPEAYLRLKIERPNPIPKRILQIAIGDEYVKSLNLPQIKNALLKPFNTEYEYTLFTDTCCQNFLQEFYPEFSELYTKLERPQYKSDLIRYLYLYKYGGYYIDMDIKIFLPLYTIFERTKNSSTFFAIGAHTSKRTNTYEVCNGFVGTKPGRPEFLEVATLMKEDPNPEDYGTNIKRLYKTLSKNQEIQPFQPNSKTGIYFFREVAHLGKYFIVNHKEVIGFSNGHTLNVELYGLNKT